MALTRRWRGRHVIRREELKEEEVVKSVNGGIPRVGTGRRIHRIASDQVGLDDDRRELDTGRRRRTNSRVTRNEDISGGGETRGEWRKVVGQRRVEIG